MKYLFLSALLLFSQNVSAQFVKRAPMNVPEVMNIFTNRVFQRVDRENGIYYYNSNPLSFTSALGGSGGKIVLQPFISVTAVTGETQFHLWVSYYPPLSPAGGTSFIRPKYLSILTARQKITLPLLYYYTSADIPAGTPIENAAPGRPSPLGETAYAVLSPENLSGLAAIALEGINDTAVEAWEPSISQRFQENVKGRIAASNTPSAKRSINDYIEFQKSIGSSNTNFRRLNWGRFDPIMPPMADQRAVSLVLYGETKTEGVDTVQEKLIPMMEMMDLYEALSNRKIAMP